MKATADIILPPYTFLVLMNFICSLPIENNVSDTVAKNGIDTENAVGNLAALMQDKFVKEMLQKENHGCCVVHTW